MCWQLIGKDQNFAINEKALFSSVDKSKKPGDAWLFYRDFCRSR